MHRYGEPSFLVEVDRYSDDRRVKLTLDDLTEEEATAILAGVKKEGRP